MWFNFHMETKTLPISKPLPTSTKKRDAAVAALFAEHNLTGRVWAYEARADHVIVTLNP